MIRPRALVPSLFAVLCACSGPDGPPVEPREDSASFEVSRRLQGREVKREEHGPWLSRTLERPAESGSAEARERGLVGGERRVAYAEAPSAAGVASERFEAADDGGIAPPEGPGGAANGSPLRAGSTDDNAEFEAFLRYLADARSTGAMQNAIDLDVADRILPRVVDETGRPLPGARVGVLDEENDVVVWSATTYGDGCFPVYPRLLDVERLTAAQESGSGRQFLVEVRWKDRSARFRWDGRTERTFRLEDTAARRDPAVRLDVVFVIDTTGSMGDEIARIKASLLSMTAKLRSLAAEFDLRYGAVLYRDLGDEYVTRAHPFTADIEAFDRALQEVRATGGGDTPESLNQGLAVCVSEMEWRPDAARVAFLIADAPPHLDYDGDVPYDRSLREAVSRGIRIHAVAASGLDDTGSLVFRQIAQFTRGKFVFIEYGTLADSAADHGVTGAVKSNNLDDILFEQLRDEIATYGR